MALQGRFCHTGTVLRNPQKSAIVLLRLFRLVAPLWQDCVTSGDESLTFSGASISQVS